MKIHDVLTAMLAISFLHHKKILSGDDSFPDGNKLCVFPAEAKP